MNDIYLCYMQSHALTPYTDRVPRDHHTLRLTHATEGAGGRGGRHLRSCRRRGLGSSGRAGIRRLLRSGGGSSSGGGRGGLFVLDGRLGDGQLLDLLLLLVGLGVLCGFD